MAPYCPWKQTLLLRNYHLPVVHFPGSDVFWKIKKCGVMNLVEIGPICTENTITFKISELLYYSGYTTFIPCKVFFFWDVAAADEAHTLLSPREILDKFRFICIARMAAPQIFISHKNKNESCWWVMFQDGAWATNSGGSFWTILWGGKGNARKWDWLRRCRQCGLTVMPREQES